jgi:DNA mismatch endonuclease (patch repair protein)
MTDVLSAEQRRRNMAAIRGTDTKPELRVRRALHAAGLRYRLHVRGLPGTPDLVFPSRRVVLFVHGCFWHQHPLCHNAKMPASRPEFWGPKLVANVERDRRQQRALKRLGWRVIVIWECQAKDLDKLWRLVERVRASPTT